MRYRIHDFVEVNIDPDVAENVVSAIKGQIGYFIVRENSITKRCGLELRIRPFSALAANKSRQLAVVENEYSATDNCAILRSEELALEKTEKGFVIYVANGGYLSINIILQLLFIEMNVTLVHAAAVENREGKVILFPAFGGAGKTSILGELVRKKGYRLLGDDLVCVTKDGKCFSYPRSFILYGYHKGIFPEVFERFHLSEVKSQLKNFIVENMPFKGVLKSLLGKSQLGIKTKSIAFKHLAAIPVKEIFGREKILDFGTIQQVLFLQRYNGNGIKLETITKKDLSRRLFSIIHHEWMGVWKLPLIAGGFGILDLPGYYNKVLLILENALKGKTAQVVWIPERMKPETLALRIFEIIR